MAHLFACLALVLLGHAQAAPQGRGGQVVVEASPYGASFATLDFSAVNSQPLTFSQVWMKWSAETLTT